MQESYNLHVITQFEPSDRPTERTANITLTYLSQKYYTFNIIMVYALRGMRNQKSLPFAAACEIVLLAGCKLFVIQQKIKNTQRLKGITIQ